MLAVMYGYAVLASIYTKSVQPFYGGILVDIYPLFLVPMLFLNIWLIRLNIAQRKWYLIMTSIGYLLLCAAAGALLWFVGGMMITHDFL